MLLTSTFARSVKVHAGSLYGEFGGGVAEHLDYGWDYEAAKKSGKKSVMERVVSLYQLHVGCRLVRQFARNTELLTFCLTEGHHHLHTSKRLGCCGRLRRRVYRPGRHDPELQFFIYFHNEHRALHRSWCSGFHRLSTQASRGSQTHAAERYCGQRWPRSPRHPGHS